MLILEIYLTVRYYFKISFYLIYHTTHIDGTAHSDIAIIIKNNIRYHEVDNFKRDFL